KHLIRRSNRRYNDGIVGKIGETEATYRSESRSSFSLRDPAYSERRLLVHRSRNRSALERYGHLHARQSDKRRRSNSGRDFCGDANSGLSAATKTRFDAGAGSLISKPNICKGFASSD